MALEASAADARLMVSPEVAVSGYIYADRAAASFADSLWRSPRATSHVTYSIQSAVHNAKIPSSPGALASRDVVIVRATSPIEIISVLAHSVSDT